MKVFVSWSGDTSLEVAKAIKDWLPNVIQSVDVFLSSVDIAPGEQWFTKLGSVLDQSDFGILCLTSVNLSEPWILYEAGALSKRFENAQVVPLLIDVKIDDVKPPLSNFNAVLLKQAELRKLATSVNSALGAARIGEKQLERAFNAQWNDFEASLKAATQKPANVSPHKYDVFLSAPMAAYDTDEAYIAGRAEIEKLFVSLTEKCGFKVYWAAEKIKRMADFEDLQGSAMDDLEAVAASRTFIMVYPMRMPTSALFEAGYAMALKIPCHYFVRDREDLPFLMKELAGIPGASIRIHEKAEWRDYDDLAEKLCRFKAKWF